MYIHNTLASTRNINFIIIDEICLQLVFVVTGFLCFGSFVYTVPLFCLISLAIAILDAVFLIITDLKGNILKCKFYFEFVKSFFRSLLVFAVIFLFAYFAVDNNFRYFALLTVSLYFVFSFVLRVFLKAICSRSIVKNKTNMLIVTSIESAEDIINRLTEDNLSSYMITGIVACDKSETDSVLGYPVIADLSNASDYMLREWVDSVYINAPVSDEKITELMNMCILMGIAVHYQGEYISPVNSKTITENIGGNAVNTTSLNVVNSSRMILKRAFDIGVGLIGSVFAILLICVFAPIIKAQSPGPILFSQERIGKNGKRFKILKIRSMNVGAEANKHELDDKNLIKDGLMFRLEFDPRVIGNKILPDGTKKTGIGEFIRKYSLDEFPQFFNVLNGTMSIVGTRPPTKEEFEKYKYHHKARLSAKSGITGMWQVYGRGKILDFDEVVHMDTDYIKNWSPMLDLKLIFKTLGVICSS